jgi:methylenetetrahydrofolate reductase (NADPH)
MTDIRPNGSSSSSLPAISFEFFPPKNEAQAAALEETVARLAPFRPPYVSVTYGAGGSSQERSLGVARRLHQSGVSTAAHLTCAGASRDSLAHTIGLFREVGIERFVALRGDPPGGLTVPYEPHPMGYRDTAQLVETLKLAGAHDVAVSAYPERHPQSADWDAEIATLKRKVDAGADRAITQFFFENDVYEVFLERVRAAGIGIPIDPGIMPIHRFASICTFAGRCGATIPARLATRFDGLDPESESHERTAVDVVTEQMADLIARGVRAFHIYTLNRTELTETICRRFGVLPEGERAAA